MAITDSRVTIHMAASLDGFIARKDGSVDWLETSDEFAGGETMDPEFVATFLKTIDCYVMGSRTYETALNFEAKGLGWAYGDKPTFVLTNRDLPKTRDTVEFYSGDLAQLVNGKLRPTFRSIWFVGGGVVSGECLRLGLADEATKYLNEIVAKLPNTHYSEIAQKWLADPSSATKSQLVCHSCHDENRLENRLKAIAAK